MARDIRVRPLGRMGNWMFQYLLARILQLHVPEAKISGVALPQFGIDTGAPAPISMNTRRVDIRSHVFPFRSAVDMLRRYDDSVVNILWTSMRMEYLRKHLNLARSIFPIDPALPAGFDDRYLVISVRIGGDVLRGRHPNYTLLPISWYRDLIARERREPIFVGQVGDDAYSLALRREFKGAHFIFSSNPLEDFNTLRTSSRVVLSVSSFAWMAAWLSTTAERIILPVIGLYHPLDRPDVDMLPVHDKRYEFHLFPRETWRAQPDQVAAKIGNPAAWSKIRSPRFFRAKAAVQLSLTRRRPPAISLRSDFAAALASEHSGY